MCKRDATLLSRVSRSSRKSDGMQGDMTRMPLPHSNPHISQPYNAMRIQTTYSTLQLYTTPQIPISLNAQHGSRRVVNVKLVCNLATNLAPRSRVMNLHCNILPHNILIANKTVLGRFSFHFVSFHLISSI
jgi:hypothetical protein